MYLKLGTFFPLHDFILSLYTQSDKEWSFVLFKQKITVMSQICYTHSQQNITLGKQKETIYYTTLKY